MPIGILDFKYDDERWIEELYCNFLHFSELDINFIGDDLTAFPSGLRISKLTLEEIKDWRITEIHVIIKPVSIEITDEHINSLDGEIQLSKKQYNQELVGIDTPLLSMWEISKFQNYFDSISDQEKVNLANTKQVKIKEIKGYLEKITISTSVFALDLKKLVDDVIEGNMIFNDEILNYWFNKILAYAESTVKELR